jgi:hypothetical protein
VSFDLDTLYNLLPSVYRIRDLAQISGDTSLLGRDQTVDESRPALPLLALIKVFAEQIAVLEENLAQLYDDQFIETCAEWAIPYIGDLVGYTLPHDTSSQSLRSEVANTIRYRKRKGTVTLFEQLARDITGWDAHVVEYFHLLATTQHLQRLRPDNTLIDVRQVTPPQNPPSPFEALAHTADVRNIETGSGRYNIANIGIFLWHLNAYQLSSVPVAEAPVSDRNRYLYYFNPLGSNLQLFTHPQYAEEVIELAGPLAVAAPINETMLAQAFSDYYGLDKSLWLTATDTTTKKETILLPDPLEPLIHISDALYTGLTSGRLNFPQLAKWSEELYKGLTGAQYIAYSKLAELINLSEILYNSLASVERLDFRALADLIKKSQNLANGLKELQSSRDTGEIFYSFTICDLRDEKDAEEKITGWKASPEDSIAIDPRLGRLAFPKRRKGQRKNIERPQNLRATFYYGFSADMGGGEYHRSDSFIQGNFQPLEDILKKKNASGDSAIQGLYGLTQVPAQLDGVQKALDMLANKDNIVDGVVELKDSGRMEGLLQIRAAANQRIELRGADKKRPLLILADKKKEPELLITGEDGAQVTINGLVIAYGRLHITGNLRRLSLRHCTLVPGKEVVEEGKMRVQPLLCLDCESNGTLIEIDHSITGKLEIKGSAKVSITNSIVDALNEDHLAYAGPTFFKAWDTAIDTLSLENCTVIGRVHTSVLEQASNTIFSARPGKKDEAPVYVERRQQGCVRYSYLPTGSRLPQRRFLCQPQQEEATARIEPYCTSPRYGDARYAQLSQRTSQAILRGADDGAEMGAFHDLFRPQRESNLRLRLQEYLRFGFDIGIFYQI